MRYAHVFAPALLFASILGCSNATQTKPETHESDTSRKDTHASLKDGPDDPRNVRHNRRFSPTVKMAMDQAEEMEVYSLEPLEKAKQGEDQLRGYKVLGKTKIRDAVARKQIVAMLEKGMENAHKGAKCFDPRHAVFANYGGNPVDVLICFECEWMYNWVGADRSGRQEINLVARPLLDGILKDAGIPLAKPQHE